MKEDGKSCNNYRGISILNVANKIYSGTHQTVITEVISIEEQIKFEPVQSSTDDLFMLKPLTDKTRGFNKETCIAFMFIDYGKVFDKVK
jgi:hypothetical protein